LTAAATAASRGSMTVRMSTSMTSRNGSSRLSSGQVR
jgi:hypothetical protein